MLCLGCVYANTVAAADTEKCKCLFCQTEAPSSDEEDIERLKKRVEANDAWAMFHLGSYYQHGMLGLRQDHAKALELYHKSAKLGSPFAQYNLSVCYQTGCIGEKDTRKATSHEQLAAMAGELKTRYSGPSPSIPPKPANIPLWKASLAKKVSPLPECTYNYRLLEH
jgi:TPR repeat protein